MIFSHMESDCYFTGDTGEGGGWPANKSCSHPEKMTNTLYTPVPFIRTDRRYKAADPTGPDDGIPKDLCRLFTLIFDHKILPI